MADAETIRPTRMNAVSFKAWRVREQLSVPVEIGEAANLADALSSACAGAGHKDTLFILADNGRTTMLHAYAIRQGKREYRGAVLGYVTPLKPDPLFSIPVHAFDPVEPWRWEPGCDVVGNRGETTIIGSL
jgi:hypothetical protein